MNRWLATLLSWMVVMLAYAAPEAIYGSGVTWEVTGTKLVIGGTGVMPEFDNYNPAPWKDARATITELEIGTGVTTLSTKAFEDCVQLTEVVVPDNITSIGAYVFHGCEKIRTIVLSNAITAIPDNAFNSCLALVSIVIPNKVTTIDQNAFQSCGTLTSISIPDGVTTIKDNAFSGCTALTRVNVYASTPPTLGSDVFEGTPTIYVFADLKDAYTNNNDWKALTIQAISLTANEGATGVYWTTYYNHGAHVSIPDGTEVYKVTLDGTSITLGRITDNIIPAGQGVLLRSTSNSISVNHAATSGTALFTSNSLKGTETAMTNPKYGQVYVLNKVDGKLGFYKLSKTGTLSANKAYLQTPSASTAVGFFFDDEGVTGMEPQLRKATAASPRFDLMGRPVSDAAKGLLLVGGKKVFVK